MSVSVKINKRSFEPFCVWISLKKNEINEIEQLMLILYTTTAAAAATSTNIITTTTSTRDAWPQERR